ELADVFLALANPVGLVAVPGTGFLDDALRHTVLDDLAFAGYALAIQDFELGLLERRRHLVLYDLHASLVADDLVALLNGANAAVVEPDGCVELQSVAAVGRLRAAAHDTDLHADLTHEEHHRIRRVD